MNEYDLQVEPSGTAPIDAMAVEPAPAETVTASPSLVPVENQEPTETLAMTGVGVHRRAPRRDAVRNRELLLQAGAEVFAVRGLEASMDEIARRAGLGVGTAYRHFANKFELADELFRRAVGDIGALARASMQIDDPWSGLESYIVAVVDTQASNRGMREILLGLMDGGSDGRGPLSELDEPFLALFERARAAGVLRADVAPTDVGFVIVMLCAVADATLDHAPELWRRYLPVLLDGLRPGAEAAAVPPLPTELMAASLATRRRRLERAATAGRRRSEERAARNARVPAAPRS